MIVINSDVSVHFKANSIFYDMKILTDINHIHDNKVNNISEFNLLHDKLNPSKCNKNINSHY